MAEDGQDGPISLKSESEPTLSSFSWTDHMCFGALLWICVVHA